MAADGETAAFWDEWLRAVLRRDQDGAPSSFGWATIDGRALPPGGQIEALLVPPEAGADSVYSALD